MTHFQATQVRRHRQNIERYCRLLATELTDLERQYVHKRIAEEYGQLQRPAANQWRGPAGQPNGPTARPLLGRRRGRRAEASWQPSDTHSQGIGTLPPVLARESPL
jgi:hypothetical protein